MFSLWRKGEMSEQIPKIKIGDYIRVMQTDDMVKKGCANKKGIVVGVGTSGCVMREFFTLEHYNLEINTVMQISKEDLK